MARTESLRDIIGRTLSDAFPGVEIVDRDVELGGGRHADFAALDVNGRLLLVIVAAGAGDETLLRAIDALAFARRELALLATHLASPRMRTDVEPIVVVAAAELGPELCLRLNALDPQAVRCFELHKITSASTTRTYLADVTLAPRVSLRDAAPRELETPRPNALVVDIERRLVRIDSEVERTQSGTETEWRVGAEVLCSMSISSNAVAARVPNAGAPRCIDSFESAELLLDDVVRRYLELAPSRDTSIARVGPQAQLHIEAAAMLTPEEVAAFRER